MEANRAGSVERISRRHGNLSFQSQHSPALAHGDVTWRVTRFREYAMQLEERAEMLENAWRATAEGVPVEIRIRPE